MKRNSVEPGVEIDGIDFIFDDGTGAELTKQSTIHSKDLACPMCKRLNANAQTVPNGTTCPRGHCFIDNTNRVWGCAQCGQDFKMSNSWTAAVGRHFNDQGVCKKMKKSLAGPEAERCGRSISDVVCAKCRKQSAVTRCHTCDANFCEECNVLFHQTRSFSVPHFRYSLQSSICVTVPSSQSQVDADKVSHDRACAPQLWEHKEEVKAVELEQGGADATAHVQSEESGQGGVDANEGPSDTDAYAFTHKQVAQMKAALQTMARGMSELASVFELDVRSEE